MTLSALTATSSTSASLLTGSELRFRPMPSAAPAAAADGVTTRGDRVSLASTKTDAALNWKQALQLGARGDSVRGLQSELQVQGAPLRADGQFGGLTRSALRNFQAQHQLTQDGIAGPRTQKALGQGLKLKPGQELEHGSKGTKVRGLQSMLNQIGGSGSKKQLKTDGRFGDRTERAVLRFQEKHGLDVDGVVGPQTLRAMNSAYRKSQKRAARTEGAAAPAAPLPKTQAAPVQSAPAPAQKTVPTPVLSAPPAPAQTQVTQGKAAAPAPVPSAPPAPVQAQVKQGPAPAQSAPTAPARVPERPAADPVQKPAPTAVGTHPAAPAPVANVPAATPPAAQAPAEAHRARPPVAAPVPAHVAEKPRPAPLPEKPKEADYGLSARTRASLQASGKWETFQKLPPDLANRYATLSPTMREKMYTQMNGSTWGFSHREAFVNGSAMGQDAFKMMGDKLEEAAAAGKLNPKEVAVLQGDLGKIRRLTPTQRDAIAEAILLQGGR